MKQGKAEMQKENMLQFLFLEDVELAKSFLRQEGYNPEEDGKKGALFVQKLLRDAKIAQAAARVTLWEKAKKLLQEKMSSQGSMPMTTLIPGFSQLQGIPVFNRNLSEIDPDDIAEILSEQELLEMIEQLEKQEGDAAE
jgi:hypothetical protein